MYHEDVIHVISTELVCQEVNAMNEIDGDGHPVSLKQHMLLYSMKQPDAKLCLALHILPQISCKVPKMSSILNVKKQY